MRKVAVVLAGGKGERFWPLSRENHPKQCLPLENEKTLIENTIQRLQGAVLHEDIFVSTGISLHETLHDMLPDLKFIVEPMGRDSAAGIGFATATIYNEDPEAVIAFVPSDHVIKDVEGFQAHLDKAFNLASKSPWIVTLGIEPQRAATEYGYIKTGETLEGSGEIIVCKAERFVEKPDKDIAQDYMDSGEYLWNSGMFIARADLWMAMLKKYMPSLHQGLTSIIAANFEKEETYRIFETFEKISIDYGIMEKADNIVVVQGKFDWDDVGNWSALSRILDSDRHGNTICGSSVSLRTENCVIYSEKQLIATLGVKNLVIVSTEDSVFVCTKKEATKIKDLVSKISKDPKIAKHLR